MRMFLIAVVAVLTLAVTAQAGNPSLCAKDGWATAQSANGTTFNSLPECARAREVFKPTLTITPSAVGAGEVFTLTATGFHADASSVVYFAITGQDPYGTYVPARPTLADGSFSIPFVFAACGNSPDDLTLTFVDSLGVHASARLTLC